MNINNQSEQLHVNILHRRRHVSTSDPAMNLLKNFDDNMKIFQNILVNQILNDSNSTLKYSTAAMPYQTALPNLNATFASAAKASGFNNSSLLVGIAILYSILIMISLLSNPLLIYVLLWRRKSQIKLIDIFVANLSLSDLFLTIFNIPLCLIIYFSEQWPFGSLLCQLGTYATSCSIYVNIFTMAYISIDRYFAVTSPLIRNQTHQLRKKSILFDHSTRQKIYIALAIIWLVALVLSVPQFLFSKLSKVNNVAVNDPTLTDFESSLLNKFDTFSFASRNVTVATTTVSNNRSELEELLWNFEGKSASDAGDLQSIEEKSSPNFAADAQDEFDLLNEQNLINIMEYEDPLKRCIVDYPIKNMKHYMVMVNFSLQYLIPSIVILYFYGKIIYHLYLNLNVEELMDSPNSSAYNSSNSSQHNNVKSSSSGKVKFFGGKKSRSSIDLANELKTTDKVGAKESSPEKLTKSTSLTNSCLNGVNRVSMDVTGPQPMQQRKRSRMRVEGLNRTKNLKKSIKVMIIIITLFLLSWLPIHLYRLVTTFYPIVVSFVETHFYPMISSSFVNAASSKDSNSNSTLVCDLMNSKNNSTQTRAECILNELKSLNHDQSNRLNTLHNRYVFFFCYFMSMSSVCYNPVVYFWMHKKFREEVKQLFSRIFNVGFTIKRTAGSSMMLSRRATASFPSSMAAQSRSNSTITCSRKPILKRTSNRTSVSTSSYNSSFHQRRKESKKAFISALNAENGRVEAVNVVNEQNNQENNAKSSSKKTMRHLKRMSTHSDGGFQGAYEKRSREASKCRLISTTSSKALD